MPSDPLEKGIFLINREKNLHRIIKLQYIEHFPTEQKNVYNYQEISLGYGKIHIIYTITKYLLLINCSGPRSGLITFLVFKFHSNPTLKLNNSKW